MAKSKKVKMNTTQQKSSEVHALVFYKLDLVIPMTS